MVAVYTLVRLVHLVLALAVALAPSPERTRESRVKTHIKASLRAWTLGLRPGV